MNRLQRIIALIVFLAAVSLGYCDIPYPVVFVHGWNGDIESWGETAQLYATDRGLGDVEVIHFCLNHNDNQFNAELRYDTLFVGWSDLSRHSIVPSANTRVFVVNFDAEAFPLDQDNLPIHPDHSGSTQSAAYKQGAALGSIIRRILTLTGRGKVTFVGHSMGGLAIREYLQRVENGQHRWWVAPTDSENGHHVARVVTVGTPHFGSNFFAMDLDEVYDPYSEAVRDLRTTHHRRSDGQQIPAVYLFGGQESDAWPDESFVIYDNQDINCNGSPYSDQITGISSELGTMFVANPDLPLPSNIWYTWITSNSHWLPGSGDGIVERERQWLHIGNQSYPTANSDSLLIVRAHWNEPDDYIGLQRGLDIPSDTTFAYQLPISNYTVDLQRGDFTVQSNREYIDDEDCYSLIAPCNGIGTLSSFFFANIASREIHVYSAQDMDHPIAIRNWFESEDDPISFRVDQSEKYFIKYSGVAANAPSIPYGFSVTFTPSTLTLSHPISAQSFAIATQLPIQWTSTGANSSVILQINRNYPSGNWETLFASTPNDGQELWQVVGPTTQHARIRVVNLDNSDDWDQSDADFVVTGGWAELEQPYLEFGNLLVGQLRQDIVTIRNYGDQSIALVNNIQSPTDVMCEFPVNHVAMPNQTVSFAITWSPQAVGVLESTVDIPYSDGTFTGHLYLQVHGIALAEPTEANIYRAEYFFDADPGIGRGRILNVLPSSGISVSANLNTANLTSGFHRVSIRFQDEQGHWSACESRMVYIATPVSGDGSNTINRGQYAVDNPLSESGQYSNSSPTMEVSITQYIGTSGLTPGFHRIFYRFRTSAGRWSAQESRIVYITTSQPVGQDLTITQGQYAIDSVWTTDTPSFVITPSSEPTITQNLATTNLSSGFHRIFLRMRSSNRLWSAQESRLVYVTAPQQAGAAVDSINCARYAFDSLATGISLDITPSDTPATTTSIATTDLPTGFHRVYFQYQTTSGIWSAPESRLVYLTAPVAGNGDLTIAGGELYIDTDPGLGQGVAMSALDGQFDASAESLYVNTLAPFASGTHRAFVRIRDNRGTWSAVASDTFRVLLSTAAPQVPQGVTISVLGNNQYRMNWLPVTSDVSGNPIYVNHYWIYRASGIPYLGFPTNWTFAIASTDTTANLFVTDTSQYYRVTAVVGASDDLPVRPISTTTSDIAPVWRVAVVNDAVTPAKSTKKLPTVYLKPVNDERTGK